MATAEPAASLPQTSPTPIPPTTAAAPEKKRSRLGCIVIGVVALLVIGFIASLGNDPDATGGASATPTPTDEATTAPSTATESEPAEATVEPSPIATLEPEPVPAFATIQLSGTGSAVPRFEIPVDAAAIAVITHGGAANFIVWAVDEAGEQQDLLVNTIGAYAGTVVFDEASGSHSVAFDVEADGPWSIEVKPVTEAFRWNGTETLAGGGDDVAILDPASSGLKTVALTHQGDGNFTIWAYGPSTDLIVNEIGPYSGEVLLTEGTFLFEIAANGPWTIGPPQ